jgi:PKD repeat protein
MMPCNGSGISEMVALPHSKIPRIHIPAMDTYEVCLTTTNVCGDSDTICQSITVCEPIVADYTYNASYLTVSFTDETPNATGWVWYFGDNTANSFSQNPSHTYAVAGTYDACVVASDICNNSDISCKSITVCAPIVANFSTSEFYLTASFSDLTGSAITWQWDFGDGGSSSLQNPFHTYASNGSYMVCLTATDVCGNIDSTCQLVTVCAPLASDFSYSSTFLTSSFTDLSNTAVQWQWDFGDGNTSTDQNPSHTFAVTGTYHVCLTAIDFCGNTDSTCQDITVCSPVETDFSYSQSSLTINFSDLSFGAIQWLWTFGDGGVSADQNPSHTYADYGTYDVCLISFNPCTKDTMCKSVDVQCPPFDADFLFEVSNLIVSFSDLSTNAIQWQWDFGDGTISSLQNPVHVYAQEGEYTVCLIASDGCSSDTLCETVTVVISAVSTVSADGSSFEVYPNPLSGTGIIELSLSHASSVQFDLYDVQGKNRFFTTNAYFAAGLHHINLPDLHLAKGVYFIRMTSEVGMMVRKVVVQ